MEGAWLDISVPFGKQPSGGEAPARAAPPEGAAEASGWLQHLEWLGTYVMAPPSLELDVEDTERLPLSATVGKARVLHLEDEGPLRAGSIADYEPRSGERLLLRTRNSTREWWKQPSSEPFVMLTLEAARLLVERGVACVGVDYVSRPGFHPEALEAHQCLRDAGVWLIEGLDLGEVKVGMHELVCLPLKVKTGWGSPARALVRALRPSSEAPSGERK